MTIGQLQREYGLDNVSATFLHEYMQESNDFDIDFIPIKLNTVLRFITVMTELIGHAPDLQEVRSYYIQLPENYKRDYGDKYLLGCSNFLLTVR